MAPVLAVPNYHNLYCTKLSQLILIDVKLLLSLLSLINKGYLTKSRKMILFFALLIQLQMLLKK